MNARRNEPFPEIVYLPADPMVLEVSVTVTVFEAAVVVRLHGEGPRVRDGVVSLVHQRGAHVSVLDYDSPISPRQMLMTSIHTYKQT